MAQFTATVYQNEFLPDGGTDVNAIVTLECAGAGVAGRTGEGEAGEIIIVDTSGSMGEANLEAARSAARAALEAIVDGTWFAVIAGTHRAYLAYPPVQRGPGMVRMDPRTRAEAAAAVSRFRADGGTAMGAWLHLARRLFESLAVPLAHRHAILLTDGENHNETPTQLAEAIAACTGAFQCDCRGIGAAWKVDELRRIAQALLGTVDVIPHPSALPSVFAELMSRSMGRGVPDARLHLWTPQGAEILFVKQVSPFLEDLTHRATPVGPQVVAFPTGAWGDEARDYHVAVRVSARTVGQEQLAARVRLAVGGAVMTQGLVKARWSDDASLTAPLDAHVAHYTGQAELAEAIHAGLAAKAAGDTATATTRLGRAVQLAALTGNAEAAARLGAVVDVDDPATGRVRLKARVDPLDEMSLDTRSTTTTRLRS